MICYACYREVEEAKPAACCEEREREAETPESVWWHMMQRMLAES